MCSQEEVRQSLIILSRQAARFASGIIQSTGTSPAEKEDACHALHCAVAHVFPALDRLIFARFSVKAPKAAPRTDGDATTNANAGEAAQKTDPAHQPVEASMGHFALHGKASMHGSLLAAVLHLRGARSQVPETGSDPAALLMGLEEASWAAIERCACAPGADAATGWRKLQVYIYRKTTLEYLFLALFECAQLVKTDPCVVATIISCWIKASTRPCSRHPMRSI